jgi:hypothetical protein
MSSADGITHEVTDDADLEDVVTQYSMLLHPTVYSSVIK